MGTVEERIDDALNGNVLMEFLGAENVERIKTEISNAIISQVIEDLQDNTEWIISPQDITEDIVEDIIKDVKNTVRPKVEKELYERTTEEIIKILKINKKEVKDMSKKIVNGLEVNGENIITSLKIIKQVCEYNQSTNGRNCPFNVDTDSNCKKCLCGITDLEPNNWKILEYTRFQALG